MVYAKRTFDANHIHCCRATKKNCSVKRTVVASDPSQRIGWLDGPPSIVMVISEDDLVP